jgi:thiosulfate dehydrogenase
MDLINKTHKVLWLIKGVLTCVVALMLVAFQEQWFDDSLSMITSRDDEAPVSWLPPAMDESPSGATGELIRFGRELVEHTARYLGPRGTVRRISNGLNCQNCHLDAGTRPFAANFGAVASTYPKFRSRSGTIEGFEKRVNDCIERSLNGVPLNVNSRELRAIVAYLKWIGKDVRRGTIPFGTGLMQLRPLDRPGDPLKGRLVYEAMCARCHGTSGQGVRIADRAEWIYPPVWGSNSYNTGAGLFRISTLAGFVKANMPYGVSYQKPLLSDEEAWDVAAFINSMPRPEKEFAGDWPDLASKPVDHPFGPYADAFSEAQHKYGPFAPILKSRKAQ